MLIRRIIFSLIAVVTVAVGFSQTPGHKSVVLISASEAREAVALADTGATSEQFFEAAMKSGRIEIIEACWEGTYTHNMLSKAVRDMDDSPLKDQLVSRYLRNPLIEWPSESETAIRGELYRSGTIQFIIPLVQRYLPTTPADYSVISTREKRLKLADAFDAAAGIPIEKEPEAKRVWPPKPGDKPGVPSAPTQQEGTASKPNALISAAAKSGESTPLPGGWALWAGIAAFLATAFGWLLLRSKRRKG